MAVIFNLPSPKLIYLKSFTGDRVYTINPETKTCNCYAFSKERKCKHLAQLNLFNPKTYKPGIYPTFAQGLSALVKSIRLRRTSEALYWLVYLYDWKYDFKGPDLNEVRKRLAKRILICAAEDGHSIAVMEKVAENYKTLTKINTPILYLAAEVMRICSVPNWWHPVTNGPSYINAGMRGDRVALYGVEREPTKLLADLRASIENLDTVNALARVMAANQVNHTRQAEFCKNLAIEFGSKEAERLADIHLACRTALSSDNNYIGQAVWWLCGNVSPVVNVQPPIIAGAVYEAIEKAREAWKTPHVIPDWCCDGTHSAGNDPRFMGAWQQMNSAYNAYRFYDRLDPEDKWLPSFNDHTGLVFADGPYDTWKGDDNAN